MPCDDLDFISGIILSVQQQLRSDQHAQSCNECCTIALVDRNVIVRIFRSKDTRKKRHPIYLLYKEHSLACLCHLYEAIQYLARKRNALIALYFGFQAHLIFSCRIQIMVPLSSLHFAALFRLFPSLL